MAVDAMSVMERDRCIRNGLCFVCQKKGHLSRECPDKPKGAPRKDNNQFRQKKVASTSTQPTEAPPVQEGPKALPTVEDRAKTIAEMLKGSDEDNAKIREMLGFH